MPGLSHIFIIITTKPPSFLCIFADGYISNTCVDIDYEEVKRKLFQSRPVNSLPPPPPSPPVPIKDNDIYYDVDSSDPMNRLLSHIDFVMFLSNVPFT